MTGATEPSLPTAPRSPDECRVRRHALDMDYLDRQARLFPLLMQELQQGMSDDGPQPTEPEVLGQIDAPLLVLLAQQTRLSTWLSDSAKHVAQHVADSQVRKLPAWD